MLTGLEGGDGDVGVECVRRRDGDEFHRRVGDKLLPGTERFFEPEALGRRFSCGKVDIGNGDKIDANRRAENQRRGLEGHGMGLAHETRSNDADADRSRHVRLLPQIRKNRRAS